MQALSEFLAKISDYDITGRNDAGIQVVSDILIEMGVGHLVKGVPAALGAMRAAKAADEVAEGAVKSGPLEGRIEQVDVVDETPGGASPEDIWRTQLPPGTVMPHEMLAKPRNVSFQQESDSCLIACVKMVAETQLGKTWSEGWFRQLSRQLSPDGYRPGGTYASQTTELLRVAGVPGQRVGTSIDGLARATATGNPAIAAGSRGHAVVVDYVLDTSRGRYVIYRDPWSVDQVVDPVARRFLEKAGYHNHSAVPEADFVRGFFDAAGRGDAIVTLSP